MPETTCVVCGATFVGVGRASICSAECRRARRRAYDAGVAAETGGLPPPTRDCVICGTTFAVGRGALNCCSAACRKEKRRRKDAARWAAMTPEQRQVYFDRAKRRRRLMPAWARDMDRRKWERVKADPERLERARRAAQAHYARHAAEIQRRRRKRLALLTDAELAELRARMRGYVRAYTAKRRNDPEFMARLSERERARWERRKQEYQDYQRERRARLAAADQAAQVASLRRRLEERSEAAPRIKACVVCGKPVVGRRAEARVCSADCRRKRTLQLLYPPRPRPCVVCGTVFDSRTSAKTCSRACARARHLSTTPEALPPDLPASSVCEQCGATYRPHRHGQRGCSPACRKAGILARRRAGGRGHALPPTPCAVCGATFAPDRRNARVCPNPDCRAEAKRRLERERERQRRLRRG